MSSTQKVRCSARTGSMFQPYIVLRLKEVDNSSNMIVPAHWLTFARISPETYTLEGPIATAAVDSKAAEQLKPGITFSITKHCLLMQAATVKSLVFPYSAILPFQIEEVDIGAYVTGRVRPLGDDPFFTAGIELNDPFILDVVVASPLSMFNGVVHIPEKFGEDSRDIVIAPGYLLEVGSVEYVTQKMKPGGTYYVIGFKLYWADYLSSSEVPKSEGYARISFEDPYGCLRSCFGVWEFTNTPMYPYIINEKEEGELVLLEKQDKIVSSSFVVTPDNFSYIIQNRFRSMHNPSKFYRFEKVKLQIDHVKYYTHCEIHNRAVKRCDHPPGPEYPRSLRLLVFLKVFATDGKTEFTKNTLSLRAVYHDAEDILYNIRSSPIKELVDSNYQKIYNDPSKINDLTTTYNKYLKEKDMLFDIVWKFDRDGQPESSKPTAVQSSLTKRLRLSNSFDDRSTLPEAQVVLFTCTAPKEAGV